MYRRVESQMVLVGLSKKQLAERIDMRYNTLLAKFNGTSSFTLDEALDIKKAIRSDDSIECLFERESKSA